MENPGRTLTGTGLVTNVGLVTLTRSSGLVMTTFMSWQNLETRSSGWSLRPGMGGQRGLSTTPSGDQPGFQNRHWFIIIWYRVEGEDQGYRLHIGGYSGTAGDSFFGYHNLNGKKFSTRDRDNVHGCAQHFNGGWWWHHCSYALLNGVYSTDPNASHGGAPRQGLRWQVWITENLKSTSMTIRSKKFWMCQSWRFVQMKRTMSMKYILLLLMCFIRLWETFGYCRF